MSFVVSDQRDADAAKDFAVKKMIRESFEIGPAELGADRMKSSGTGSGESDEVAQLLLEFVAKDW